MPRATLTTLTEWTKAFTHEIFETPGSGWLDFFEKKVSPDAKFTINGHTLTRSQAKAHWEESREKFASQKIDWQRVVEMPKDPENPAQAGIVAGFYVNTGFYTNPKKPFLPAFVAKRTPHIYIESQNPNSDEDTRQLVALTVVSIETAVPSPDH